MHDIEQILRHTVHYKLKTGATTDYGEAIFASLLSTRALVETGTSTFTDPNGKERRAEHRILTLTELPRGSRVWVPGKDTNEANDALEVAELKGATLQDGTELFEVTL